MSARAEPCEFCGAGPCPHGCGKALENALNKACGALKAICTANDSGPWITVYRAAGGGYEGLQAIAAAALVAVGGEDRGGR